MAIAEDNFKPAGKRSRAWWLQAVKWYGNKGATAIMKQAGASTYYVGPALDALIDEKYVEMSGKKGRGLKSSYSLTSVGHRYLNEHTEELEEPAAAPAYPKPTYYVPVNPEFPGGRLTAKEEEPPISVSESEPNILRRTKKEIKTPLNTPQNDEKPVLQDAFMDILHEILVEKYASMVTAKEIMERMQAKK